MMQSIGLSSHAVWQLARPTGLVRSAHGLAMLVVVALACIFGQPPATAAACATIPLATSADCRHDAYPHWMADNADVIGQRPLSQVVLPAAHDAASAFVPALFAQVSQAQNLTVGEQLDNGVRVFDLRFCQGIPPDVLTLPRDVYACHGSQRSTETVSDIVSQIDTYTRTPGNEKEILVLDYQWFGDRGSSLTFNTCGLFLRTFKALLIPNNLPRGAGTTLNQLWSDPGKRRIIAKLDGGGVCDEYFASFPEDKIYDWSKTPGDELYVFGTWGNSPFKPVITDTMFKDLQAYRTWPQSQGDNANSVSWRLQGLQSQTTDASLYLGAIGGGNETLDWLEANWNQPQSGFRGIFSMVWADYVQLTNITRRAIRMNQNAQAPTIKAELTLTTGGTRVAPGGWASGDVNLKVVCNPGFFPPAGWTGATQTSLVVYPVDAFAASNDNGTNPLASPTVAMTVRGEGARVADASCDNPLALRAKTSVPVKIDRQPPTIAASATNADGTPYAAGTSTRQAVTVHFTCADQATLSGLASCPQDQVFTTDGTFTVSGAATDNAGNSAGASFGPIQVDKTVTATASVRTDLAGARIQQPGSVDIYLVDNNGTKRHIPDPPTYFNLFRDGTGIQPVSDVSAIANGPSITRGAYLAIAQETMQTVYLVDNGQKRGVTSPAVMDKFHFAWGQIRRVPQSTLDALPTGASIT